MLSVFIPSFNHGEYVIETIQKALAIPVVGKKLYIIDDCSTDNSVEIISDFLASNDHENEIEFVIKDKNLGVVDSLNRFLCFCRTEYMYLMASDDIVMGSAIADVVQIMNEKPSLKFVIGGGVNLFESGKMTHIYSKNHQYFFDLSSEERFDQVFLNFPSPILSQSSVIRVEAINKIGGWDSSLLADDFAMFMKLLVKFPMNNEDFLYLPDKICVKYRHHSGNSYKRLVRQFHMTSQTLEKITPENLKQKAISNKLGFYLSISLKRGDINSFFQLLKITKPIYWPNGMKMMFLHIFKGIRQKCSL